MKDCTVPDNVDIPAWRHFALLVDGIYAWKPFWDSPRVQIPHGDDTITLSHSSPERVELRTRMAIPAVSNGFWFTLRPRRLLSDVGVWLGMPDMKANDPRIDGPFVLEGNHDGRVRELLADDSIRPLIEAHPTLELGIDDSIPRHGSLLVSQELYVSLPEIVCGLQVLTDMRELLLRSLYQLRAMNQRALNKPAGNAAM